MNYEECRTKAPVMNVPLLFLPNGLQTTDGTTAYSLNSHSSERAVPENRLNTKPGVLGISAERAKTEEKQRIYLFHAASSLDKGLFLAKR